MSRHAIFCAARGHVDLRGWHAEICVSTDADGSELRAAELWFDETEQKWNGWELCVESAFQTPYFGGEYSEDVAEHLQEIVLGNSDHAAADMCVLYDSEENVIRDTNTIYHKQ